MISKILDSLTMISFKAMLSSLILAIAAISTASFFYINVNQDPNNNQVENQKNPDYYDYLKLALQWQPGFSRARSKEIFTIHGLWPSRWNDRMAPQNCYSAQGYDGGKLASLRRQLDEKWPSLRGGNEGFWRHEWNRHGSCAKIGFVDFFKQTLNLYDKLDPNDMLSRNGLRASNSGTLSRDKLSGALTDRTHNGKKPELNCNGDNLKEARFCFTPNFEPIDCPDEGNCRSEIRLPESA